MKGRFLVSSNEDHLEGNIYADRSALILDWLLREGVKRREFSLREVAVAVGTAITRRPYRDPYSIKLLFLQKGKED